MNERTEPIVVEETFDVPPEIVWKAITDPGQMRQWFFEQMNQFRPEVGFETKFEVQVEDRVFPHVWNVTEVIPGEKIAYGWRYDGYPGDGKVTWELSETLNGTNLKLTAAGIETFSQDIPEFTRESCQGGWNYFLRERLKPFLAQK